MPLQGLGRREHPFTLGAEFMETARVLRNNPPARFGYRSVIYFLLGHASELFLKAYLHAKGKSISILAGMGHKLASLVSETRRHGLPVQCQLVCVTTLSPLYVSKAPEYRGQSKKFYPLMKNLFGGVVTLSMITFNELTQPTIHAKEK